MATSGSVFSETLQEITNTKLDELSKKRARFENAKSALVLSAQAEGDDIKRLLILSRGVKECFDIKADKTGRVIPNQTKHKRLEIELQNIDRFLDQARCDPSVSQNMLRAWESSLHRYLDTQSLKFQYASLYGQLVTEWLSGDKVEEENAGDDIEMGEAFELVGNAKKLESRMEWERMVFESANVNEPALNQYLDRIFGVADEGEKGIQEALRKIRDAVSSFEPQISTPDQFSVSSLKWVIKGLHSSDLLSDEKREVLKDFEGNTIILNEIADVLNMRISALGSWTWSSDTPVRVEMRRKISGIYNIHMHQDLLQAIFLHYIGVKWSVFFKNAFKESRRLKDVWKPAHKDIPKNDKLRLGYYLGPLQRSPCLQSMKTKTYNSKYFMAKLLSHEQQTAETADGEEEAEYAQVVRSSMERMTAPLHRMKRASRGARRRRDAATEDVFNMACDNHYSPAEEEDDYHEDGDAKTHNPMSLKKTLLHMLSAEITINTRLYGEMTAFHSVFENWNHLLPHQTICVVLKYLGVSDTWLGFFRRFLEAPLKFTDDDESAPIRKRRRGTPPSHVLSDMFGETSLFCLDFAVNQSTSGNMLWRINDDIWFWSRDHDVAVKAWKAVDDFATITGTKINKAKTGTVRVSKDQDQTLSINDALPKGEIRWGFLCLSPQTGKFEIDQRMVDSHIEELHKQLHDKRKSILAFIQAWNTYAATFFTSNFGSPANCFGREHVDNMLSTHERVQRQVFSALPGDGEAEASSVAEYLKNALSRRFGINDIPDGYLFFPMELGGLDLQSPFISLLQIRDEVVKSPSELLEKFEKAERDAYKRAETKFLDGHTRHQRHALDDPNWVPESVHDRENFMSFEEYVRYREDFKFDHYVERTRMCDIFEDLMKQPVEKSVEPDKSKVWTALDQIHWQSNLRGMTNHWNGMEPYWRWVAMMYGPELVDRFGGLNVVDPGLLPMGMVALFRDKRVKW